MKSGEEVVLEAFLKDDPLVPLDKRVSVERLKDLRPDETTPQAAYFGTLPEDMDIFLEKKEFSIKL